jgi:hypothetical protein
VAQHSTANRCHADVCWAWHTQGSQRSRRKVWGLHEELSPQWAAVAAGCDSKPKTAHAEAAAGALSLPLHNTPCAVSMRNPLWLSLLHHPGTQKQPQGLPYTHRSYPSATTTTATLITPHSTPHSHSSTSHTAGEGGYCARADSATHISKHLPQQQTSLENSCPRGVGLSASLSGDARQSTGIILQGAPTTHSPPRHPTTPHPTLCCCPEDKKCMWATQWEQSRSTRTPSTRAHCLPMCEYDKPQAAPIYATDLYKQHWTNANWLHTGLYTHIAPCTCTAAQAMCTAFGTNGLRKWGRIGQRICPAAHCDATQYTCQADCGI